MRKEETILKKKKRRGHNKPRSELKTLSYHIDLFIGHIMLSIQPVSY